MLSLSEASEIILPELAQKAIYCFGVEALGVREADYYFLDATMALLSTLNFSIALGVSGSSIGSIKRSLLMRCGSTKATFSAELVMIYI